MSTEPRLRKRFLVITLAAALVIVAAGGGIYWVLVSGFFGDSAKADAPKKPAPPVGGVKPGSDLWLQDFAAAKEKAAREQKDILLSFEGSDWCIWCQRMEQEIFNTPEFRDKAPTRFVLVKIDFPRDEPAKTRVHDAAANERLQQQFGIGGFPAVVLTDSQGDVFGGFNGFFEGGAGLFVAGMEKLCEVRVERDKVLAEVDKQEGAAKLAAAKQAMQFLMQRNLVPTLKRQAPVWLELAQRLDPDNRDGYLEQFFEFDWFYRFQQATPAQLPAVLNEVVDWRKRHGEFKDKERAAFLWMELAKGKTELEDYQGAFMCLDEGLKLQPKDPRTRQQLQNGPLALGLGTGTAFAVSAAGHFLTNAHVAGGPGKVFLQLPGQKQLTPAQVVAEKLDLDLALLKIAAPKGASIKGGSIRPLPIAGDHVPRRGEEVAAWGYPLGTTFGHGLKLTKGVISALPEPGTRNMLLLDLRINPGNSGSPLCDAKGNVIGIVTARSQFLGAPDSYGMAVPGKEVLGFLAGINIESAVKPGAEPLTWDEIDRRVSAAVAMVIKARPAPKKGM
ncbi:MAG: trypsin-like peptidase domain-containing protein [Gemmataceae bacterium]|nr:trypsin-like peptidase domain-containing protein [Gemmataceae bacterium]